MPGVLVAPQGSLSFPISGRWRLIIREEAFFCFLYQEHMEVNLDLSLLPPKRAGRPRELQPKAGLSLALASAPSAAVDQRPGKL